MLRPERMSKVSVTGAKPVMDDVIETVHDLNLVHLSDYDGSWEGFDPGNPTEGAENASEKLVTVRSLESILDIESGEASSDRVVTEEALETELEEVRQEANELDDRRSEILDELRSVEDEIGAMAPFKDIGIDLDLLSGYETLEVTVGKGKVGEVETALQAADDVQTFETFSGEKAVAVFARPAEGAENVIDEALVGVDFETATIPDASGEPENHVEDLRQRETELESKLESVETELDELRDDAAGFLLAAEEKLTIEVQKAEAPLQFATTKNSFVSEGWIPTNRYDEFVGALHEDIGDHVEIEELERASFTTDGHEKREPVEEPGGGGEVVATDGGHSTVMQDDPPVIMDNPAPARPLELLVKTAGLPKYTDFDPTILLLLTFPAFFGFMIGDFGYGLLYTGIGYLLYSRFKGEALSSLGGIAMWAGGFTTLFGLLYGEIFGLHVLGEVVWEQALGMKVPMHKGLQPHYAAFAEAWMLVSLTVGLLHVGVGHALGFVNLYYLHDLKDAVLEKGSWLLLMGGFWIWVFSTHLQSAKPDFIYKVFNREGAMVLGSEVVAEEVAYSLGFGGLPAEVGLAAIALAGLGFVMLVVGEGPLAVEFLQAVVNVLSYVRLMAVLLAKAGMAFVVNLLVFGAYETEDGEFHFLWTEGHGPEYGAEHGELMFSGLFNADGGVAVVIGFLAGILLLVLGHLFVLALGITSAGLQGVRLEYVEFFGKFYDGGGRSYDPFGYTRKYTTED